jgi:hypothetical protein
MAGVIHTEKLAKRFPGHKKGEVVDAVRDLDLDVAKARSSGCWVRTAPARRPPSAC